MAEKKKMEEMGERANARANVEYPRQDSNL